MTVTVLVVVGQSVAVSVDAVVPGLLGVGVDGGIGVVAVGSTVRVCGVVTVTVLVVVGESVAVLIDAVVPGLNRNGRDTGVGIIAVAVEDGEAVPVSVGGRAADHADGGVRRGRVIRDDDDERGPRLVIDRGEADVDADLHTSHDGVRRRGIQGEGARIVGEDDAADGERVGLCVGAGIQQEDGGFLGCSVARIEHDSAGRDLQLAAVIDAAVCIRIGIRVGVSVSVSVCVCVRIRIGIRIGIRSRTTGVHRGTRFVGSTAREEQEDDAILNGFDGHRDRLNRSKRTA